MGMYDSFIMEVKCPHCGNVSEIEFQTKQFNCTLAKWKKGDLFETNNLLIIDGVIKNVRGFCYHNKGLGEVCSAVYADIVIQGYTVMKAINIRLPQKGDD
jgi:phage FluMu protein Com